MPRFGYSVTAKKGKLEVLYVRPPSGDQLSGAREHSFGSEPPAKKTSLALHMLLTKPFATQVHF
jgi:hypothetical protein